MSEERADVRTSRVSQFFCGQSDASGSKYSVRRAAITYHAIHIAAVNYYNERVYVLRSRFERTEKKGGEKLHFLPMRFTRN